MFCRGGEVHSNLSLSTPVSTTSISNTGHRFLQPRVNSGSSVRRTFPSGTSPTPVPTSNSASGSGASFTYQSVSIGMEGSGVALPVQRIIEGLPVVTLPGIVAHEVRWLKILGKIIKDSPNYDVLQANHYDGWSKRIP